MVSRSMRAIASVAPGGAILLLGGALLAARAQRTEPLQPLRPSLHSAVLEPTRAVSTSQPPAQPAPARCPAEPPLERRSTVVPPPLELARLVRENPKSLGSASIGIPTRGRLWGAVEIVASDGIEPRGDQPWGTEAAVRSIERAVREVQRCFPGTPKLDVGDISRKEGGWLRPHRSHQSGLDADLGYYYVDGAKWFTHANDKNLDRPRTWALVRALIEGGNVESIFMDRAVQKMLREHAETLQEEQPKLDDVFESATRRHDVFIKHTSGHATHLHVRFSDPAAVALGLRLEPMVARQPVVVSKKQPPRRPTKR